jgi:hypothetical protein
MWFGFFRSKQKGDFQLGPGDAGYLQPEEGPTLKRRKHPMEKDAVDQMIGQNADGVADNQPTNQPW